MVMGLGIGALAIKLGLNTLQRAKASAKVDIVSAVVAVNDIPATVAITQEMVKALKTPVTPLLGRDSYQEVKDVIGRVALTSIPRGAVVNEELLAPKGTPSGLTVRIPMGFRAVSVKVNEVSSVGYQLRPGSIVDVIAVMRTGRRKRSVSRIILQQIKVVAVGRALTSTASSSGKTKAAKSVTLLVKDTDVPKLHMAQTSGKVTLAMRSPDDTLVSDTGQAHESELLGESRPDPRADQHGAPETAQSTFTVTVVNGNGKRAMTTFAGSNSTRRVMGAAHRQGTGRAMPRSMGLPGNAGDAEQDWDEDEDENDGFSSSGAREPSPG